MFSLPDSAGFFCREMRRACRQGFDAGTGKIEVLPEGEAMSKIRVYHISVLTACCLMTAASMGLTFYPAGLFYKPVAQGLNASVGSVSAVTFFVLLSLAVSSLFVPWLLKAVPFKGLITA